MTSKWRRVAKRRTVGVDRFVMLPHYLLKSPAWKSLTATQRALFIEVAQRYNGLNNGKIGLGIREAALDIHVKHTTVVAAFRVLQERGFLVMARNSTFDQKRLTREWRVTAYPMGDYRLHPQPPPTNEFMKWQPPQEIQNAGPFKHPHSAHLEPDQPQ